MMSTQKIKVYIAGPYTSNPEENVKVAIDVWERLHNMGYTPFCPHLMYYINNKYSHPYNVWMNYGIEWLLMCDAVFRIPGISPGSDVECNLALRNAIPVFKTFADLDSYFDFTDYEYIYETKDKDTQIRTEEPARVNTNTTEGSEKTGNMGC